MSQEPPRDPLDAIRLKALDGELPTQDVARLAAPPSNESDAAAERTLVRTGPPGAPASPPEATTSPATPTGKPFGRYVLLDELGHGGMGVVWKAYDTELQRIVALKGLIAGEFAEREQVERFMREARSAARLSHPGIVPVHDVGEHGGYHFFTAEYVEGRPLDAVMRQPVPVKQSLAWVKAIAEALQYAHQQGIVHRDVKPGNVLIDRGGQVHVMDFGLAKQVEQEGSSSSPALTLSGDLLGTPRYMSPEQTRGAAGVGPASDQFSLGAVMYELLTGRPPFDATSMRELLNTVCESEPARPTELNARLHHDVETICLKALEKDPTRRYATIGALAADIGRYLEGEPIEARPVSTASRWARKAAKHKAIVAAGAAALLVALSSAVYAVATHFRQVREVAAALDRETRARRETEVALAGERAARQALEKSYAVSVVLSRWSRLVEPLRRMEGVCYDRVTAREEIRVRAAADWEAVHRFVDESPKDSASQATVWALAGWGRELAGYEDEGESWMEKASRLDPEVPYGALLRAMVLFSGYLDAQPLPATISGAGAGIRFEGHPPETADMALRREEMLSLLAEAERAPVWGSREVQEYRAALEGIRSLQRGDAREAVQSFTEALGAPALAWMETSLLLARGRGRYLLMDFEGAKEDLTKVVRVRPRHGENWNDLGLVAQAMALTDEAKGLDPRPRYGEAIEVFGRAVEVDPAFPLFRNNRGVAWKLLGVAQERRGDDPRHAYGSAIAELDEAIRLDPSYGAAHNNRGTARCRLGEAEGLRGGDPRGYYEGAVADFDEALRRAPEATDARLNRSNAYMKIGKAEAARENDPRDWYRRAISDLDEALRRAPEWAVTWNNRGNAYQDLARAQAALGEDPQESLASSIADYGEALARNTEDADALSNRGNVHRLRGEIDAAGGRDPDTAYRSAIADFERAIAIRPAHWPALANLGAVHGLRGEPGKAVESFEAALRIVGDNYPPLKGWLAEAHVACARDAARRAAADPEKAAGLRDEAFRHLSKLAGLGFDDVASLEADPVLAPLRDDARWKELLARLGRK